MLRILKETQSTTAHEHVGTRPRIIGVRTRNYRVMIKHRDGSVALFRLEETLKAARIAANTAFRDYQRALDNNPAQALADGRPFRIYVQLRMGSPIDGRWETVLEHRGGFDRVLKLPRKRKTSDQIASGDLIDCKLLPDKTRRGGWRACIVGTTHVGPVLCHNQPPADWQPGMTVKLQLCSLSRRSGNAQFSWA